MRSDGAGQQSITPYIVLAQCTRGRLDQRRDASFRWGVVGLLGAADEGGDGGDADDGAAWGRLCGELLGAGLDGVEGAGEVCGEG